MSHIVRFGSYEADLDSGQLRKHGVRIRLRQQSFEVLTCLVEHPGELVTREDLQRRLWSDEVCVDFENSLNTAVAQLRQVLGDSADHPHYIETFPRRGYRLIADVFAPPESPESKQSRTRLLVLPFQNLSGDATQEYFSDAMTDEIITALAGIMPEHLAVIARTTAMRYKGSHKDLSRIGRELRADHVVEGGILRSDDRIGINVQLIRTSDQTHLFAKKFEAEMREVFSLHDRIAQEITEHIPAIAAGAGAGVRLAKWTRRKPTENLAAYHEYVKGRDAMLTVTPQGLAKAKEHFEAALARDPDFALAYCGFAQLYWYIGFWGFAPSRQTDAIGRFYALRAIEIDPTLAEAYALLSYYPKQRHYNEPLCYYEWQASLKDVLRARELNPRSELAQMRHAIILMVLGRNAEAAAELEDILQFDPLSMEVHAWFVEILSLAREFERALEEAHRVVELEPQHFLSYFSLGQAYLGLHRYDESAAANRRASELSGGLPLIQGWLGMSLGLGGHTEEARAILDRLEGLAKEHYVPPTCFAWIHLGLGNVDEAFVWMDRSVDAPDRMMSPIKSYPFLDPHRADRRFAALLEKMKLQ